MTIAEAISRYCLRRLPRSEVNDVVAEVFAIAWRKVDHLPAGSGTLPWLYAAARNEVMRARRTQARRAALGRKLNGQARHPEPGPEIAVLRNADIEALTRAPATLRPTDQEVLMLRTHEGLAHADIALVLGCSVDAAKKRSVRALRWLRKAAGIPEPVSAASQPGPDHEGGRAQ
ncbi:MAG TPA: sigma-70 family RNA polymerase sigma factor [Acidimicrobiia bacterium]|nr:sigma-70 family RNA polymerase sigma factor [Acidimicrobiia bacterium]